MIPANTLAKVESMPLGGNATLLPHIMPALQQKAHFWGMNPDKSSELRPASNSVTRLCASLSILADLAPRSRFSLFKKDTSHEKKKK